ncbi:MAG: hypothetical protein JXQ76_05435 [Campylobacterales bacterium]|nr:hypothetical protein [Campylobacterales bacterium]
MKTVVLFFTFISFVFASSVSVEDIKMMVHKIRDKRQGIDMNQLEYTENPFVSVQKDENQTTKVVFKPKREEIKLTVDGIVNQKARINGKWMGIGDMIADYNVSHITPQVVTLYRADNNSTKQIFVYKKKNILDQKE